MENALQFYLLACKLKYKLRSGWDNKHWNILGDRRESVAEHVYGVCMLAISLYSQLEEELDFDKVLKMLVIHELGECLVPDATPFDGISPEEKLELEHEAVMEITKDFPNKVDIINLILEFDEGKTKEARFAFQCDKLDADIQSKVYQDKGLHHSLDDQENNIVMNSSKVKEIIHEGAKTAFDVWYEYDKNLYEENSIFEKALEYVKEHNTNI